MMPRVDWSAVSKAVGYILAGAVVAIMVDRTTQGVLGINRALIQSTTERDLRGSDRIMRALDEIQVRLSALGIEVRKIQQPILKVIDVKDLAPVAAKAPPKIKVRRRARRKKKQ